MYKNYNEVIENHEAMIEALKDIDESRDIPLINHINRTGLMLALHRADYQCEYKNCNHKQNLTAHHLIKQM